MNRCTAILLTACLAVASAPVAAPDAAGADPSAAVNLVANPSFEASPMLSGWTCEEDLVFVEQKHPGVEFIQVGQRADDGPAPAAPAARAAAITAATTGDGDGDLPPGMYRTAEFTDLVGYPDATRAARCSQDIPVRGGATYRLSVQVLSGIGVVTLGSPYGTVQAPASAREQQLSTTFTTAADADRVEIFVQGVVGGDEYRVDDVVLTGPDSVTRVPDAPSGLAVHPYTSRALKLEWTGVPGATGYRAYVDGALVGTSTGTGLPVYGLTAGRSYAFTVEAINSAGVSARSAARTAVSARAYDSPPEAPAGVTFRDIGAGGVLLEWWRPNATTDGSYVYVDGVLAGWVPGTNGILDVSPGDHTYQVTALNSAGESALSTPATPVDW